MLPVFPPYRQEREHCREPGVLVAVIDSGVDYFLSGFSGTEDGRTRIRGINGIQSSSQAVMHRMAFYRAVSYAGTD